MSDNKTVLQEFEYEDKSFWIEAKKLKKVPGYYKWWAKEKLVKELLDWLGKEDPKFKKLVKYEKMKREGHFEYDKTNTYCCVYVGKSDNVIRRIVENHICGSIRNSTMRRHLGYIIQNKITNKFLDKKFLENAVDDIIQQMKVSFVELEKGLEQEETCQINRKLHILNVKKNDYGEHFCCQQAKMIKCKLENMMNRNGDSVRKK